MTTFLTALKEVCRLSVYQETSLHPYDKFRLLTKIKYLSSKFYEMHELYMKMFLETFYLND